MSGQVWKNDIERDAWVESNCLKCYQPDQAMHRIDAAKPLCPHLARSLENKMPAPFKRRRNAVMGQTYKCEAFMPRPPVNRRGTVVEEVEPMVDVEPVDRNLVPVDGWPDFAAEARKQKEGDHQ